MIPVAFLSGIREKIVRYERRRWRTVMTIIVPNYNCDSQDGHREPDPRLRACCPLPAGRCGSLDSSGEGVAESGEQITLR